MPDPRRMGWPGWGGDEIAVGVGIVEGSVSRDELATCQLNFRAARWIGAQAAAFHDNTGGREKLRAVANRGNRFFGGRKVLDDLDDARRQAQIFGCSSARNHQRIVGHLVDFVEICI